MRAIKRVVIGDFPVQGVKVAQTYHQDDKTLRDKPSNVHARLFKQTKSGPETLKNIGFGSLFLKSSISHINSF